jgi:hypothetical protein
LTALTIVITILNGTARSTGYILFLEYRSRWLLVEGVIPETFDGRVQSNTLVAVELDCQGRTWSGNAREVNFFGPFIYTQSCRGNW